MTYGAEQKAGYDGNIVVFSPEGRLFQVEYAREAIKRGSTIMGMRAKRGVVLLADRKVTSRLTDPSTVQKIFQVDDSIWVATSGLTADGRALVDLARRLAQANHVAYDEEIGVKALTEQLTAHMQAMTHGGNRPYGAGLIIADDSNLYETDPSGTMIGCFATVVGAGRAEAMEYLEEKYDPDMEYDDMVQALTDAMEIATDGKFNPTHCSLRKL